MVKKDDIGKPKICIEEPKIGEVFSTRLTCLNQFAYSYGSEDKLTFGVRQISDLDAITLLKYCGNGIFQEYYTGRGILFCPVNVLEYSTSFEKRYDFERFLENPFGYYSFLSRFPIFFYTCWDINDEIKIKIAKQEELKEDIITQLEASFIQGKSDFESSYEYVKNYPYMERGEQIIKEFEKSVIRKLEK